jgi:type I restriction enzyme S subunit
VNASSDKQLRYVFSVTSGATPESGKSDYWDGDIRWITPEDVSGLDGYWLSDTRRKISQAGYDSCGTSMVPRNSIVLTKRAPIGQLAVLAESACSNQGCFLLVPRGYQDSRFYYYWLSTQVDRLQMLGRGSTFMELSTDELKALKVPEPILQKQRSIADYLDHETTRIDALIAAKERLLELLAEKRRALITRAVTRGLDPNVPMRDSGVPWLGEIPAHWEKAQLKRFLAFITSGSRGWAEYYSDIGAFFLRIGNLTRNTIRLDLSEIQKVDPPEGAEGNRTRVQLDDLLFSITAYLGSVAIVTEEIGEVYRRVRLDNVEVQCKHP